jgi:hypothetical protein
MHYVLVSITQRNWTCYISHYQAIYKDRVSAVEIYRMEVCVCLFFCKDLHFMKIDTSHNYKENGLEICAVELD